MHSIAPVAAPSATWSVHGGPELCAGWGSVSRTISDAFRGHFRSCPCVRASESALAEKNAPRSTNPNSTLECVAFVDNAGDNDACCRVHRHGMHARSLFTLGMPSLAPSALDAYATQWEVRHNTGVHDDRHVQAVSNVEPARNGFTDTLFYYTLVNLPRR